jgi:uncharacterized protein
VTSRTDPAAAAVGVDAGAAALCVRAGAVMLRVRVTPRARREGVLGWRGGALCVAVSAVPERGEANRAVLDLLATALDLRRGALAIVRGGAARDKTVRVAGVPADELRARLAAAVTSSSGARPRRGPSREV